jgi:hypothetical protein
MKSLSSFLLLICFTINTINNLSIGEPAALSFVLPSAQIHVQAYFQNHQKQPLDIHLKLPMAMPHLILNDLD